MRKPGFTLLEMMVVVLIALVLMSMLVPVFQVTTRTVMTVERRLSAYEAARMMLDFYEGEIQMAGFDCRGNHFGIKKTEWEDTDKFTPAGTTERYASSLRHASEISFIKPPSYTYYSTYSVSQNTALVNNAWAVDCNITYMSHDLACSRNWQRAGKLGDVSALTTSGFNIQRLWAEHTGAYYADPPANTILLYSPPDPTPTSIAPGFEGAPWGGYDNGGGHGSYVPQLPVMDFDVQYWDEAAKEFKNVPKDTAAYFAPVPKAVRITITCCDSDKRAKVTLSRIVRIPVGTGSGALAGNAPDPNMNPTPYNRLKDMKALYPNRY
ncbi:MAG TPA: type II secretion system protein [Planctomycetota bacterium]|nr:type II secretion system protein [Planctomycetota bacterium]